MAALCFFLAAADRPAPGSQSRHVMSGPTILMMIYANGKGVPPNPGVAMKLGCELKASAAPAEMEARIARLDRMRGDPTARMDVCQDITSGFWGGFRARIEADFASAKRKRVRAALIATWPAPACPSTRASSCGNALPPPR